MTFRCLKIVLLIGLTVESHAQQKYWISDKLDFKGTSTEYCSEWLGQCSCYLTDEQVTEFEKSGIRLLPVQTFEPLESSSAKKESLGFAMEQVEGNKFVEAGLTGKGVKIGVIDGGFMDANKWESLGHLFKRKQIVEHIDYITPDRNAYTGSIGLDDIHGTEVLQLITGYDRKKEIRFGIATEATFYLARTDHGAYEKRLEEDLVIQSLEDMHKKGVRLINLSLGYGKGYADPKENYTPLQMDGKTSMLARAVDSAYYSKNMLVVVSAGNEFTDRNWRYLVTPADAHGALTVGAAKMSIWEKIDYSSVGTPSLQYVKPDISCFSTEGTSFSAPMITGIAAGIMQYDSTLDAASIRQIIEQSGNYFPYPNDYVGYGVPTCSRILSILRGDTPAKADSVYSVKKSFIIQKEPDRKYVVLYHKKMNFKVFKREIIRPDSDRIKIKRFENAERSTVLIDNKVTEIFWKDIEKSKEPD